MQQIPFWETGGYSGTQEINCLNFMKLRGLLQSSQEHATGPYSNSDESSSHSSTLFYVSVLHFRLILFSVI
jgi:hypothetical protein